MRARAEAANFVKCRDFAYFAASPSCGSWGSANAR
jgi:hypothetical protein